MQVIQHNQIIPKLLKTWDWEVLLELDISFPLFIFFTFLFSKLDINDFIVASEKTFS